MKRKIKIVFAINHLGMGGAENMLVEQVGHIDRSRFEPYVITILPNPTTNLVDKLPKDVVYQAFRFRHLFDLISFFRIYRFIRREQIGAVITNLFDTNLTLRVAAVLARIPVILTYEHNIYREKRVWQIWVDRLLAKFTKKIIVGSTEVLEFTVKSEKLPLEKFYLNFNSIPLKLGEVKLDRNQVLRDLGFSTKETYIVAIGRLVEQKGHIHLIEAVKMMKEQGLGGYRVLIFGQGVMRQELQDLVNKYDLNREASLMGVGEIEKILSISDIFVMPSLWEGLSIALLQAMDAGCPIVGTRVSGTSEVLVHGESGLLVEPGQPAELARELANLLSDRSKREKLSKGAKKRIRKFSIEANVKKIENLVLPSFE